MAAHFRKKYFLYIIANIIAKKRTLRATFATDQ